MTPLSMYPSLFAVLGVKRKGSLTLRLSTVCFVGVLDPTGWRAPARCCSGSHGSGAQWRGAETIEPGAWLAGLALFAWLGFLPFPEMNIALFSFTGDISIFSIGLKEMEVFIALVWRVAGEDAAGLAISLLGNSEQKGR